MAIHSGTYPEMTPDHADMLQASFRWAVPFFFLVSGYLIGHGSDLNTSHRVNRLFGVLLYSSIIYIPLIFISTNYSLHKSISSILSFTTLRSGTYFHLWFLPSLIIGVLVTNYFIKNTRVITGLVISVLILLAYWASDIGQAFGVLKGKKESFYFLRTLHGISLVYIGYLLSTNNTIRVIGNKYSLLAFILGVTLMVVEVPALRFFSEAQTIPRQFPFFSVFSAIALLSLCINTKTNESFISKAGRDYSLGIYIIHPFILYFVVEILGRCGVNLSMINLVIAFMISFSVMHYVKKIFPIVYNKLNGIGVK